MVVTHNKPSEIIENMMQPRDDQYSIQDAVGEKTDRPGAQDRLARRIHATLEEGPRIADQDTQHQAHDAADDGHKAPPPKKAQVAGKRDIAVAVVGDAGDDARQQS